MIAMILLLVLSVGINIFLIVYLRRILKKMAFLSENIADLLSSLGAFSKHLEAVYELETFYGDTTLKNLIQHSKNVVKDIELYKEIYTLFHEEDDIELEKLFEREGLYADEDSEEKNE